MESSEIRFGRFRLDLRRRTLLRDDQPVRLGGRPLDILCALASAGGDVLTRGRGYGAVSLFTRCRGRRPPASRTNHIAFTEFTVLYPASLGSLAISTK